MRFQNREVAGQRLADALKVYAGRNDVVIVALPRGGVVIGRIVADALKAPLDIVVPRKIGFPGNSEYAIGAITETGQAVWNEKEIAWIKPETLETAVKQEQAEARRRLELYRAGMPPRNLAGKIVVVVDDGMATGFTMRAAVKTVKAEGATRVVVAVPVAPADTVEKFQQEVDEVIALFVPSVFFAVGEFYEEFGQVDDETVIALMRRQ